MTEAKKSVASPLQLFGLYLAWSETALATATFAEKSESRAKDFLMIVMGIGVLAYVSIAGFLLIYLVVKKPGFLFNPSDYDSSVQHLLFGQTALQVATPPITIKFDNVATTADTI